MNTAIRIFIFILAALPFTAQSAQDGNELLNDCSAAISIAEKRNITENRIGAGYCLGLIQGVFALINDDKRVCAPKQLATIQIARVIVKYLKKNPKYLHYDYSLLAMIAIQETWPCSKDKSDQ